MEKKTQLEKVVERLNLACLSGVPVAWLLTGEKEVAEEIAGEFAKRHVGDEGALAPFSAFDSNFNRRAGGDSRVKDGAAVYFQWVETPDSGDGLSGGDLPKKKLANFIDLRGRGPSGGLRQSMIVAASPFSPNYGRLNSYIETIHVPDLSDEEIGKMIGEFTQANGLTICKAFSDRLTVNLRGVSGREIRQVLARCLAMELFDGECDEDRILNEVKQLKRRTLAGFNGLNWIDVSPDMIPATGMDAVLQCLEERKGIFSDPANMRRKGYDIPKGLIVTGIPGTGKSLMAKTASLILNLPLIQMDLGELQEGVVGKSEEHMAAALRKVDEMSPCVLWIDEIEKAFSGAGSDRSDGGVMRRMFRKFLIWMQEKESFCYVFATSNDITSLPPEFIRSERFDEKFYNFMPSAEECAEIFAANIRMHNRQMEIENGGRAKRFVAELEAPDYWLRFLDAYCTFGCSEGVLKDGDIDLVDAAGNGKSGHHVYTFRDGIVPECKLFTGADISAFVKLLKFRLLRDFRQDSDGSDDPPFGINVIGEIRGGNWRTPGGSAKGETVIEKVLRDFMPYGQTNLRDIASSFLTLSKTRFKPSVRPKEGSELILSFGELHDGTVDYREDKFRNSRYNRTLYRCVTGAINGKSRQEKQ